MKQENANEKISRLYEKFPEEVLEALKQNIEVYNKAQEKGKSFTSISKIQEQIMTISGVVSSKQKK